MPQNAMRVARHKTLLLWLLIAVALAVDVAALLQEIGIGRWVLTHVLTLVLVGLCADRIGYYGETE